MQRLTESTNIQNPGSWHPSGRFLAFHETTPTGNDILILPMDGDDASGWRPGKPTSFLATPFLDGWPAFSPDGLWLAYDSNESGRTEVYVRPFPGPGPQWQVSPGGGRHPMWSKSRKEIVYEDEANGQLMAVPYTVDDKAFRTGVPRAWTGQRVFDPADNQTLYLDLHPDGERVALRLGPEAGEEARRDSVTLMFNFFEELRQIAPPVR